MQLCTKNCKTPHGGIDRQPSSSRQASLVKVVTAMIVPGPPETVLSLAGWLRSHARMGLGAVAGRWVGPPVRPYAAAMRATTRAERY